MLLNFEQSIIQIRLLLLQFELDVSFFFPQTRNLVKHRLENSNNLAVFRQIDTGVSVEAHL